MSDTKEPGLKPKRRGSIQRGLGAALTIVSILGLLLSVVGLALVPRLISQLEGSLSATIELSLSALETSGETLTIAEGILGETADAIASAQGATGDVQQTIDSSRAALNSLHSLLQTDLPQVVGKTQQSLESAQEGAQLIENLLFGLNSISALTGTSYEPETSLSESIGDIQGGLDNLPGTYQQMALDIDATRRDLSALKDELDTLHTSLQGIEVSLREAQSVIGEYGLLIDDLIDSLGQLQERVPLGIQRARWLSIFIFVWLALTQIGLAFQGWEMLAYDLRDLETRLADLENAAASSPARDTTSDKADADEPIHNGELSSE
jgi:hypothetical protein